MAVVDIIACLLSLLILSGGCGVWSYASFRKFVDKEVTKFSRNNRELLKKVAEFYDTNKCVYIVNKDGKVQVLGWKLTAEDLYRFQEASELDVRETFHYLNLLNSVDIDNYHDSIARAAL